MSIEADTKDWTWVLQRPCPDCGLDSGSIPPHSIPQLVLSSTADWPQLLARPCQQRPTPQTWSPLEYGCHVRDVVRLAEVRLDLMLTEDDPLFDNWDQDETAIQARYSEQAPSVVAADITQAAASLSQRFAGLAAEQWRRTGRRSDGASFTVESFGRYLLHDLVHHQSDVEEHPAG